MFLTVGGFLLDISYCLLSSPFRTNAHIDHLDPEEKLGV